MDTPHFFENSGKIKLLFKGYSVRTLELDPLGELLEIPLGVITIEDTRSYSIKIE